LESEGDILLSLEYLEELTSEILEILVKESDYSPMGLNMLQEYMLAWHPLDKLAHLVVLYLGASLFIAKLG
jgi:hypothetical protein